jgi:phosphinothricin acetyltransferase
MNEHCFTIRKARLDDLDLLTEIYNDEVLHGVATFDIEPKDRQDRLVWLQSHADPHFILVAETQGKAVGYFSLSPYRARAAFGKTAELSVYIARSHRGQGIATALMTAGIDMAKRQKVFHTLVSVITGGNEASIHLHEKFGFTYAGTLHEVGFKFGRLLDVIHYQLIL